MATASKAAKSENSNELKKTRAAGKKPVAKKAVAKKAVAKKKAIKRPAVKKAAAKKQAAKKPVAKEKASKPVVKKQAAKISVKKSSEKKKGIRSSSSVSKTNGLMASVAALKKEIRDLRDEFKSAAKREAVLARLEDQRDAAIEKFLHSWDKKAMAALEKSLKPRKKKKSRKK